MHGGHSYETSKKITPEICFLAAEEYKIPEMKGLCSVRTFCSLKAPPITISFKYNIIMYYITWNSTRVGGRRSHSAVACVSN